ncbi:MAG TPA: DUF6279 family lipoprotein [Ramlibacter sp.]|nr:DUF6279 family lipoprotein [Ramlibacter sp.]
MTTLARLRRIIGLLALAAVLSACSAIKLGYNNLDDLAYWWLDSYVEFSDEQAPRVRDDLARLHLWHRTQELPRFAEILHGVEELAPGDVTPGHTCAVFTQVTERLHAAAKQAGPAMITFAMSLTPEQFQHLERKYARNNDEYRKEWVRPTAAEVAGKRFKLFLERSESIYGSLDEPQRAVLRRQVEQSMFDGQRLLAERMRRQRDALQVLRKLATEPVSFSEAGSMLRGYFARVQEPPDPAERRYQQALVDEGCRNFAGLHNSTTPAQRQVAVRRLRAYQRDLGELAAQQ